MIRTVWRAGGAAAAVAMAVGLAALSRVPYDAGGSDQAVIRLAWRMRGTRVEECRTPSADEVAALPVHMRRERICEGRVLPYRLSVTLDGEAVLDQLVRARGARADRPLYVYAELPVEPGRRALSVRFVRQNGEPGPETPEHDPAELLLDAELLLVARDIALVTYDPDSRALVLRGRSRQSVP